MIFSGFKKQLIVLSIIQFLFIAAFGQTTTSAGNWTTGSIWSTGTAPNTTSLSANVIINRAVVFNSGSLTGWGSTTITITAGGSLTVTGNFILTGGGVNITVQSGGSLTVSGSTTLENGAKITIAGGGSPGSASFNSLTAKYGGKVTILSGASVSATSLSTTNNSDAIIDNQGTLAVSANVDSYGIITNSGTFNVSGNYTQQNSGNSTTNSGRINVSGNVFAYGLIRLNPGTSSDSEMIINGSLAITGNPWMIVGTNVSSCSTSMSRYANLVVQGNVQLTGSGDITVNQNGRLVVFGNVTGTSSTGTLLTINCGGQVYVDGNINLGTGGGNTVANNNSSSSPTGSNGSPVIGLYVKGTTTAQTISGTVGNESQLQSNDLTFYNYISTLSGSPLPISLAYFVIDKVTADAIALKWATYTELNFDRFEIEKSVDGKTFYKLGEVSGHGTSYEKHIYTFDDVTPAVGKNYYRLKSIDFDGYTETFKTLITSYGGVPQISMYPNPVVNGALNIDFNVAMEDESMVTITDLSGRVQASFAIQSQSNFVTLDLSPGIYLVTVRSESAVVTKRIEIL